MLEKLKLNVLLWFWDCKLDNFEIILQSSCEVYFIIYIFKFDEMLLRLDATYIFKLDEMLMRLDATFFLNKFFNLFVYVQLF